MMGSTNRRSCDIYNYFRSSDLVNIANPSLCLCRSEIFLPGYSLPSFAAIQRLRLNYHHTESLYLSDWYVRQRTLLYVALRIAFNADDNEEDFALLFLAATAQGWLALKYYTLIVLQRIVMYYVYERSKRS